MNKEGLNITKINSGILEERVRIIANLEIMREVIDTIIKDKPHMELTNLRNKLTYQMNELNSVIPSSVIK